MLFTLFMIFCSTAVDAFFSNCGTFSSTCARENTVNTDEYIALSADEKKTKIMENVMSDTSPAEYPSALGVAGIFKESMCPTFE